MMGCVPLRASAVGGVPEPRALGPPSNGPAPCCAPYSQADNCNTPTFPRQGQNHNIWWYLRPPHHKMMGRPCRLSDNCGAIVGKWLGCCGRGVDGGPWGRLLAAVRIGQAVAEFALLGHATARQERAVAVRCSLRYESANQWPLCARTGTSEHDDAVPARVASGREVSDQPARVQVEGAAPASLARRRGRCGWRGCRRSRGSDASRRCLGPSAARLGPVPGGRPAG